MLLLLLLPLLLLLLLLLLQLLLGREGGGSISSEDFKQLFWVKKSYSHRKQGEGFSSSPVKGKGGWHHGHLFPQCPGRHWGNRFYPF